MIKGVARPPALGAWLAHQLAEQIIDGSLAGGQRLIETDLATQYGLSRAPVREALRLLAADGLVDIVPHRGAVVRPLTVDEIRNVFECLAALDGMAMRLAATRLTDADLVSMRKQIARARDAADRNDAKKFSDTFDQFVTIARAACGNRLLTEMIDRLEKQRRRLRMALVRRPGRMVTSIARVELLLRAFEAHDPDAAERVQRETLLGAMDGLVQVLTAAHVGPPGQPHGKLLAVSV